MRQALQIHRFERDGREQARATATYKQLQRVRLCEPVGFSFYKVKHVVQAPQRSEPE